MKFKRKKINVGKTRIEILVPVTESGRVRDIFFDFNLKLPLAKKYFSPNYHHSKECERFFRDFKRKLEDKYPQSLVIISAPTSWVSASTSNSDVSFSIRLFEPVQDSANELIKESIPKITGIATEIISEINSVFDK